MRTPRTVLAGTVTLALLGGIAAAALAQDEAGAAQEVSREAAVFEGTAPYPYEFPWHWQGVLTGTGAYEGLAALFFVGGFVHGPGAGRSDRAAPWRTRPLGSTSRPYRRIHAPSEQPG